MKETSGSAESKGFASKLGFILAAAGSAVGLGNIWRFPYLAAKYGGGVFLLIYIILAVTFGFALMLTEFAIGRRTRKSVLGAYKAVNKNFGFMGWIVAVIPAIILSYYCVIGGWVLRYMTMYCIGQGAVTAGNASAPLNGEILSYFEAFISMLGGPTVFFLIFITVTLIVILFGVQKGIEKICKVLMPLLFILIIVIAVYSLTLPGALDGAAYYLLPDFSDFDAEKLFKTVAAASSQLFYSTSIAMGINVTYGSYMRKEDSLESSVRHVELFDTGAAFLSGLIIVPSVFVFSGGDKEALGSGPSLMFITLPKVFETMPAGNIIGAAFFVLVSLAALTSAISLMETVVAAVMEKFNLSRTISCVIVFIITIALGMLSVLGYSSWSDVTLLGMRFLDFFDFITNSVMMPILALLTCILIGYVVKTKYIEDEVLSCGGRFRTRRIYRVMIKFICPVCMIIILLTPFFTDI